MEKNYTIRKNKSIIVLINNEIIDEQLDENSFDEYSFLRCHKIVFPFTIMMITLNKNYER